MEHTPADDNWEQYRKDIKREEGSLLAVYQNHCNDSVYCLIKHMAEVLAYQYSINRENKKIITSLLPERKKPQP